jgi:hypothetical protein
MKMESAHWLSLANYSSKYDVSISTLRRRIKTATVEFKLHDGKYFLLDSAPQTFEMHSPIQNTQSLRQHEEEPVLTSASKLLGELKKAYTSILQDKEEQIIHLKEEASDLKMLVRVLEHDNERLKKLIYSEN